MKKPDKYEEDILRQYIDPENIVKAPGGFTYKVMTRIRYETGPVGIKKPFLKNIKIPVISGFVTLALIITVFILPNSESTLLPQLKFLKDFNLPELKISFDSYFNFNPEALTTYLLAGIILLAIFDKALHGLFHRKSS
jgi:hypothetical protein